MKIATGLACAVLIAMLIAGCGGGGSSTPGPSLTPDQTTATQNSAAAVAVLSSLAHSFVLSGHVNAHAGPTYPIVTTTISGTVTTVNIDYGPHYVDADGNVYTGTVIYTIDSSTSTVTVTYNNFTINGNAISGTIQFTEQQDQPQPGLTSLTITVTNVSYGTQGTLNGTVTEVVDKSTGAFQIPSADLTWVSTNPQATYHLVMSNLVADPITHRFNAGTLTVTYMPTGGSPTTIAIVFNANTPATGIAMASVNGGTAIPFKIYS